ncbi:unnamed protein product [Polarella glacialis]|uniref:Uncharacterized protein n=1 Tax=Polarella glacialis TaxID=89957 RepID=A0A813EEM8_POLGL|nr:unnamed protein product [Polarella glacialis]
MLVVELELERGQQRSVHGHSDAVTCLAHSEEQALGASGQVRRAGCKYAEVLLWDSETFQVCATFAFHTADVEALGFVQGGEVLVTIGADRDRTMALWPSAREGFFRVGRREGAPLAVCSAFKGGGVCGLLAAPGGSDLPVQFATFGVQHVKFWQAGRVTPTIEGRRGAFGSGGVPKVVVCVAWAARDRLVAGGSNGEVYFFEGSQAIRRLQLQRFSVSFLLPLRDSLAVVYSHGVCSVLTGGQAVDVNLADLAGAPDAKMQSPFVGGAAWRQSSLLLASRTHLLKLDLSDGLKRLQRCEVLMSQPSAALTAVCTHPVEPRIYTGALDAGVRCYRSDSLQPIESKSFKASGGVTCLAVSGATAGADGSAWLAVGCDDATLSIMSESTFHYVLRRTLSARKSKLTCARFSPTDASGTHPLWLAVGTDDGCIHMFKFKDATCKSAIHTGSETVTKVATLRGHEASIFDVCFADTLPCNFLISVDASGKALAFDVPMARRLPTMALVRDVPFSPWTSPIGWQVQGCWSALRGPEQAALPPRHFVEIPGRRAIAVSDAAEPGIELFTFPCPEGPRLRPPRLEGPGAPVSSLIYSGFTDSLLACSDTVLFVWSWKGTRSRGSTREMPPVAAASSPLRAVQRIDSVPAMCATPEDQKRVKAAAVLTPPRPRPRNASAVTAVQRGRANSKENSKENAKVLPTSGLKKAQRTKDLQTPPPKAPAARQAWAQDEDGKERPGQQPASPSKPKTATSLLEVAPLPSSSPMKAAADMIALMPATGSLHWAIEPQVTAGLPSSGSVGRRPKSSPQEVAPKIGAPPGASEFAARGGGGAAEAQRIREDTEAKARSFHERQQFDSVGLILSGQARPNVTGVAPSEGYEESRAGRFQYRAQEAGSRYEVEAHLPGGQLTKVSRNPLRRTLTFEGKVVNRWAVGQGAATVEEERLVVRVPAGFDLSGPPVEIVRNFEQGGCFVAIDRKGFGVRFDAAEADEDSELSLK